MMRFFAGGILNNLHKKKELRVPFASFEEWQTFAAKNEWIKDAAFIDSLAEQMGSMGFRCSFHGVDVASQEVKAAAAPYREGYAYKGLNSRLRAVMHELSLAVLGKPEGEIRIYAPEAVTPFALMLRGRYPRFLGSEFTESETIREKLFPILCESLLELTFHDSAFDIVIVNDIFEHVPDTDKCLEEIARVTAPGGKLITTFPFNIGADESVVKAKLTDSGIEHLAEPEYHGNPVDPQGSLVFEIPGWDILGRAQAAGWRKVEIIYHHSAKYGIISNGFSGIFTLVAEK